MSRTFRNANKNKILDQKIVDLFFSWGTSGFDDRKANRIKNGAIINCKSDEIHFQNVISGKYRVGVPKKYRKHYNKKQKNKMKKKILLDLKYENFENIGGEKFVKNAAYYYY